MIRIITAGFLFVFIIQGCGNKYSEKDLQEIQRKSDSVERHKRLEEKLRMYDSLALKLDSVKLK